MTGAPAPSAWVDGRLVPAATATVSAYDRAFRGGEGVFETIRALRGHPVRGEQHVTRLVAGAEELGFTLDADEVAAAITAVLADNAQLGEELVIRVTASPGAIDPWSAFPGAPEGHPTLVVTVHPVGDRAEVLARGAVGVTVPWSRELAHLKSVSYLTSLAALRRARALGADEALLVTEGGLVTEAATANVLVLEGTTLVTPPLGRGVLLPGTTRAAVLAIAPAEGISVREQDVSIARLAAADEVLLTSAVRGVVPLVSIDGHLIGDGRPGPLGARLRAAERAAADREIAARGHGAEAPRS